MNRLWLALVILILLFTPLWMWLGVRAMAHLISLTGGLP